MHSPQSCILVLAGLFAVSCSTNKPPPVAATAGSKSLPGLKVDLPRFTTLDELKTYGSPGEGVESYHTFEDGMSKVVVVVTGWGSGAIRDGVSVYAYDAFTRHWEPVALWDTKARGVRVEFDKDRGIVHVLSRKGETIFSFSMRGLSAKASYDW